LLRRKREAIENSKSDKALKALKEPTEQLSILALDLATVTGWASNNPRQSGTYTFDVKRGESPGMRFLRCNAWLEEVYELIKPLDVFIYEQAHHRGGAATACCVGLVTVVQTFAAKHSIELMPVHTATLKKFATGSGRANKKDMIRAAQNMGWDPIDDNEADAELLLEYGLKELG